MKYLKLAFIPLLLLTVGCEVSGPKVKVTPPKVVLEGPSVDVDGGKKRKHPVHDEHPGKCPPGHRKKGWCGDDDDDHHHDHDDDDHDHD